MACAKSTRSIIAPPSHHRTRTKALNTSSASPLKETKVLRKTDILISIKPVYMEQIVERTKDHEFRNYLIPNKVERMWLYVSSPQQVLRYIAVISNGKSPGGIGTGSDGIGNIDFNARGQNGGGGYAYEIKELYQLHEPIPLAEMRQKYGVTFPQRYVYVLESMAKDVALQEQIRVF